MTYSEFHQMIQGGLRYEINGTELTLTAYWSGQQVTLDLGAIDEEMFELLVSEPEEDEEVY